MQRANAGFSLVEVLVAMSIFAIVSSAIASQMLYSTAMISENNGASEAIVLAQKALEDLRALDYADMADGADSVIWKGVPFSVVWAVTDDVPQAEMKTIVVTVSWTVKGETKSYETQSIYSQVTA